MGLRLWARGIAAAVVTFFSGSDKPDAVETDNTSHQSTVEASPDQALQPSGPAGGDRAEKKLKAAYAGNQTYQKDLEKVKLMMDSASRKKTVPQPPAKAASSLPRFKLPSERRPPVSVAQAPTRPLKQAQARSSQIIRPVQQTIAWRKLENFRGPDLELEHTAAQLGLDGIAAYLALGKSFTNGVNKSLWSSAHFVAKSSLDVARRFIEAGGNFDNCLKDCGGKTPVDRACQSLGAHTAIEIVKAAYGYKQEVPSIIVAEISKHISKHAEKPKTGWNGAHILAMMGADAVIYALQKNPNLMDAPANSAGDTPLDILRKVRGFDAVDKVQKAIKAQQLGYNDFDIDVVELPAAAASKPQPTEFAKLQAALKTVLPTTGKQRPVEDHRPTPATDIRLAVLRFALPRGPEDNSTALPVQPEGKKDPKSSDSIAVIEKQHNQRGRVMAKYRLG